MTRLTGFHCTSISSSSADVLCVALALIAECPVVVGRTVLSAPGFEVVYTSKLTSQNMRSIIAGTHDRHVFSILNDLHQTNQLVLLYVRSVIRA